MNQRRRTSPSDEPGVRTPEEALEAFLAEKGGTAAQLPALDPEDTPADPLAVLRQSLDQPAPPPPPGARKAPRRWARTAPAEAPREPRASRRGATEGQHRFAAEAVEAARIEAERVERERIETERGAAQQAEHDRLEGLRREAHEAERAATAEQQRLEAERVERERIEAERAAAQQAEHDRLAAERAAHAIRVAAPPAAARGAASAALAQTTRRPAPPAVEAPPAPPEPLPEPLAEPPAPPEAAEASAPTVPEKAEFVIEPARRSLRRRGRHGPVLLSVTDGIIAITRDGRTMKLEAADTRRVVVDGDPTSPDWRGELRPKLGEPIPLEPGRLDAVAFTALVRRYRDDGR